ncbi:MAG: hypothetical protein DRH56_06520 [Deltaproteobacteria bacterium]|nr:MAG: hypothetical protein DRH56_06520 [Deltaproteobacteria bacterium]
MSHRFTPPAAMSGHGLKCGRNFFPCLTMMASRSPVHRIKRSFSWADNRWAGKLSREGGMEKGSGAD